MTEANYALLATIVEIIEKSCRRLDSLETKIAALETRIGEQDAQLTRFAQELENI